MRRQRKRDRDCIRGEAGVAVGVLQEAGIVYPNDQRLCLVWRWRFQGTSDVAPALGCCASTVGARFRPLPAPLSSGKDRLRLLRPSIQSPISSSSSSLSSPSLSLSSVSLPFPFSVFIFIIFDLPPPCTVDSR